MATYVLVPGGWRGGWYFQPLADALQARSHRAFSVSLPGFAPGRPRADVNLDTHIEAVVELIRRENLRDVILLGHSYGGMVSSGVIDRLPDRLSTAIYCDAYVPLDGQSCFDLTSDAYRQLFLEGASADGFTVAPPPNSDPRTEPQPLATFLQRIRLRGAPPALRRCYVYLSGWSGSPFASVHERLRQSPDWETIELPVGHDVAARAFDEILEILLRFAGVPSPR